MGIVVLLLSSCNDFGEDPPISSVTLGYGQVSVDMIKAVLAPDGRLWTWGPNFTGALGNGTIESSDVPREVPNLKDIIAIDQSYGAVVAVDRVGDIWFWGNFWIYEGPSGVDTNVISPVKIAHLPLTKTVTLLTHLLFALREDGSVWRMDLDAYSPMVRKGPREVLGIGMVKAITKNLAVTTDCRLYDLGETSFPQPSLAGVASVARGINHTLILDENGTVWAWGNNELGQLGNGSLTSSALPVQVSSITRAKMISASYNLSLAVEGDTLWSWGFGGQLGDSAVKRVSPAVVMGLSRVVLVSAGMESLVKEADGTYWEFRFDELVRKQVLFQH